MAAPLYKTQHMTVVARQWQQGLAGEILTEAWCIVCQEFQLQNLGLLWWKPGRYAQGDLFCPQCREVQLLEAYIHPGFLPELCQFFVVHPGCRSEPNATGYTILIAAMSLDGAHFIERVFSECYTPFDITGENFAEPLLH